MAGSFVENINLLASKLPIIEESNEIFDEGVIPVLEEIAQLDLDTAIADLKKGNYLGNRKLDINLILNMLGVDEELLEQNPELAEAIWTDVNKAVHYDKALITFVDGVEIELPFMFDGSPVTVSTHGDLLAQFARLDYVYAKAQIDSIYQVTVGNSTDYTITIDAIPYTFRSGLMATRENIIAGIANMLNSASVPVTALVTDKGTKLNLTAKVPGNPFYASVSNNMAINTIQANVVEGPVETAFLAKLDNTLAANFAEPVVGEIVRIYDEIGFNSNVERIKLNAVSGSYKTQAPMYYWAKTTSAFQTLSMRTNDIIKLGNEIGSIILLAKSIEEVIEIQKRIPQLVDTYDVNGNPNGDETIYNNLSELVEVHSKLSELITVYNDIKVGGTNYIQSIGQNLQGSNTIGVVASDLQLGVDSNINNTGSNIDSVITVSDNIDNVNTVANNMPDVKVVSSKTPELVHLSENIDKVDDIALYSTQIQIVGNDLANSYEFIDDYGLITDIVTNESNDISNIKTVADNILDVQNAEENAIIAKEEAWRAEAERLTATSYATEPENVYVKIYTSNNDGTFTITDTVDYSSYHWEKKAAAIATGDVIDDIFSSTDMTYSSNKIEGIVNIIEGNIDTIEDDVTALDGRVSSLEGNVSTLNSNVATLNNTTVKLTGDQTVAGIKTFSSNIVGSVTGNSATATKLATARTINGVSFDGSANITVVDSTKVALTENQTVAGVKTFTSSPIVPVPTTDFQSVPLRSTNITVDVGVGQTYTTINQALEYLSGFYPMYKKSGVTATVNLKAGFVMAEQVLVSGIDLGWITIVGEDAETIITHTALTSAFNGSNYPVFGVDKGGTSPIIGQLFRFNVEKVGEAKPGLMAFGAGSSAVVLSGKGFIGAGNTGIYASQGSIISAKGANCSNSGSYGINAHEASTVNAVGANCSNAGSNGINAYQNSTVNAYGANCSNAGSNGINAIQGSTINANSANCSNAGTYGIFAIRNSTINAYQAKVQDQTTGTTRVRVEHGSIIEASGIDATGGTVPEFNQAVNTLTGDGIIYQ